MVAWTLFQRCFAVNVFVAKFSSLSRKMPTALLGAIRQELYRKGILEQSEINQYRIPALPPWITFHIGCYCWLWCDPLVQLRVSSGTLGIQPIVPARKNKAMWPGKMLSHHCRILPSALSWSSSRAQARKTAPCLSPFVFLFPRGTRQSDTVLGTAMFPQSICYCHSSSNVGANSNFMLV